MFIKTKEERKELSLELLKDIGIDIKNDLPAINTDDISMRSKEDIAKRAIGCVFAIQASFIDINSYDYNFFIEKLKEYNANESLTEYEKKIFESKISKEELKVFPWKYEAYWVLCWVLGFFTELDLPKEVCNFDRAIDFTFCCNGFDDFISKVKLLDVEKVLDEYDFIYRLHNALLNNKENDNYVLKEVVSERYMALKWVLYSDTDWDNIE